MLILGKTLTTSDKNKTGSSELEPSADSKPEVVALGGKRRLQALEDLDVLDAPSRRSFQMLVDLANKFLGTPVALISIVTPERQFFLSSSGLAEPWASCRETPLSHSFCQHVVKRNEPLVVTDAKNHELVKDNLAISELGVHAYLGIPIVLPDGNVIGSFCAIDDSPRVWIEDDFETIKKLVELTVVELTVNKAALQRQQKLESRLIQTQKMQSLGQLVGGVAHDFNNVLGAIQIQTELLNAQLEGKEAGPINQIQQTVESAKLIVQQLLNWSRPSTNEKYAASLREVVTATLPLISTFATKFIEIQFEPTPCDDTVLMDKSKIGQILLNLCSNSAHAMRLKGGKISIEVDSVKVDSELATSLDLEEGPHVVLRVSDEGCGIPEELHHRVQDPYFTTKPVGDGTGLGLWTVYGITREHLGQVHLESVENEGTTIEIYFPLCNEEPPEDLNAEIDYPLAATGGQRVLVVDDEPNILNGLVSLLNISGCNAKGFTNGLEALRLFANDPEAFDVVITDQVMPHINGEELIREIKNLRKEIPVVMCSGYSEVIRKPDMLARHADVFLEKPYQFSQLFDVINNLCNR